MSTPPGWCVQCPVFTPRCRVQVQTAPAQPAAGSPHWSCHSSQLTGHVTLSRPPIGPQLLDVNITILRRQHSAQHGQAIVINNEPPLGHTLSRHPADMRGPMFVHTFSSCPDILEARGYRDWGHWPPRFHFWHVAIFTSAHVCSHRLSLTFARAICWLELWPVAKQHQSCCQVESTLLHCGVDVDAISGCDAGWCYVSWLTVWCSDALGRG